MRRKLRLGFLAVILLIWALCVCTLLNTMSVRETFSDLEGDIVPGAIAMSKMKYEATEIRQWTLTYIIRGNVIRRGKTIKEWLQKEWAALEKDARIHLEHERHIGLEEQRAAEKTVDLSQKLISVSAEIIDLKNQGTGNDELFEKVRKEFGPVFYPLRTMLDEHTAEHLEELTAVENKVHYKHDAHIRHIMIFGILATLLALFVGLFVDRLFMGYITEHNHAEEALKEREERYRNLSEQSRDAIYITTREGKLAYINRSFLDLFGYTREELEHLNAQEMYFNPDDRLTFQQKIEQKRSVRDFKMKLRKKDGAEMACLITATVRQDSGGRILGYQGIIRDITERKLAEKELRETHDFLEKLINYANAPIIVWDPNSRITRFNNAFEHLTGYTADEVIGQELHMLFHESSQDESLRKIARTLGGEYWESVEIPILRKDGDIRVALWNSANIYNEDGTIIIATIAQGNDITERKKEEEEKKKLEAQLQYAQRMESIGTLASGIAHNFNNLLMGIMGNTSLILLDTDPNNPNYERLKTIEKSVQSASMLTRQLLGYAREGKYEIKPISLNQLVKETSDTFAMAKKEIRVHRELAEDLRGINADQGQIEQALLNLYVNAKDAMLGGGDLFLKTMNVTDKDMIDKPYKARPGNYVLLTVRDTGEGMDKKTMERIFEPFFTTKGLAKGTGLGLASVYGTIKAHSGYIDVDSEKGKGTTFKIYLPASEKRAEKPVKSSGQIIEGNGTILLVDDEEMVLDVGVQLLKALGYTVLEAKSGKEAIEIVSKAPRWSKLSTPQGKHKLPPAPDLVILDMIMPDIGGGETYDRLREINPKIKVLLSSGYSIDGQATEILERGCNGFIQKPFSISYLSQSITRILDNK